MKVKKRGLFAVLLLICLLGLVGCGGGSNSKTTPPDTTPPTSDKTPPTSTLTLKSEGDLDGHIVRFFADPNHYGINKTSTIIELGAASTSYMGDLVKTSRRGFVSFNLSSLPASATIKSATLRVYQSIVNGDPYNGLGNIFVDHVSYSSFDNTATSDVAQALYEISALNTIPAESCISTDATLGYKTLDVTAAVQADQAASRGHAQFRLSFQTEVADDFTPRLANFYSGERDTNQPELVIQYTL